MFNLRGIKESYYIFFGAVLCVIFLAPYWIFGNYSALGWYDETSGYIPYTFLRNNISDSYSHSWAGGVDVSLILIKIKVALYDFFSRYFSVVFSNLLFRFLSLYSLFLGTFFFTKKIIEKSSLESFVIATFCTIVPYIPYGWTLGGHGFDFSVMIWLLFLIYSSLEERISLKFFAFCLLLMPIVSSPIFIPLLLLFILIFSHFFLKSLRFDKRKYLYLVSFFVLLGALYVLNYFEVLKILKHSSVSSRSLLNQVSVRDILDIFLSNMEGIYVWFLRFSNKTIILLFLLYMLMPFRFKKNIVTLKVFLLLVLIPLVVDTFLMYSKLPIVSIFRWNTIIYLFPFVVAFLVAKEFKFKEAKGKFVYLFTFLIAIYSGYKHMRYSLESLAIKGGLATITHYKEPLRAIDKNYRVVIDFRSFNSGMPQYYGIRDFGGFLSVMSSKRYFYILKNIFMGDKRPHHSKIFFHFYDDHINYNLEGLKTVNVKYILSSKKDLFGLGKPRLVKEKVDVDSIAKKSVFFKVIKLFFRKLTLVPALYLYQLNDSSHWFFVPKFVEKSIYTDSEEKFYDGLSAKINSGISLLSRESIYASTARQDIELHDFVLEKNLVDFKLQTNGKDGLIVFNEELSSGWRAQCFNKSVVKLIPINGVMTGLVVPEGCKKIYLVYSSE